MIPLRPGGSSYHEGCYSTSKLHRVSCRCHVVLRLFYEARIPGSTSLAGRSSRLRRLRRPVADTAGIRESRGRASIAKWTPPERKAPPRPVTRWHHQPYDRASRESRLVVRISSLCRPPTPRCKVMVRGRNMAASRPSISFMNRAPEKYAANLLT